MKKKQRGFTMTEIVVTMIMVAILAAVTVPIMTSTLENGKGMRAKSNLQMLTTIAHIYFNNTGDTVVRDFTDLGGMNGFYNINISDDNFSYSGTQQGSTYSFTATRISGSHIDETISADQDNQLSGTWPWIN